jgi:DNA modification methylase
VNSKNSTATEAGVFYCKDASEVFLFKDSVDLFIGHPPYYMEELERNGGDLTKQMQNSQSLESYWENLLLSVLHMEYALKPTGHIFLALQNTNRGLGFLKVVANNSELELQNIRIWDYSDNTTNPKSNNTVIIAHYTKQTWGPGTDDQRPFVLKNSPMF